MLGENQGVDTELESHDDPAKYGKSSGELKSAKSKTQGVDKALNDDAVAEVCKGYKISEFWFTSDRVLFFSEQEAIDYTEGHFSDLTYEHYTSAA